ncbi:acyl-CoA dehydrogenase family protein [Skermania piniformis]|uniref:Acyl-CoA/acyl-ACP dehydrogenase n=1 Tax=Skermania pinensis TaxID=39122 RepID=A0ABX8SBS1_9ACTN|nr:acyl-CoA dehydrogenase family protein [Skermania piniformis]QXQ15314.1 acyl-CoA/acyl-ACP dehydrogenase [Skermania piniformis]
MPEDATADQRFFRATTRDFLADTMPVTTVRELAEADAGFDRDWWRRGAELGWTAMLVPEDLGGGSVSGHPMTELAIVAEELGRATAPGPFVVTSAVLAGLATSEARFADTVATILTGATVATWAIYEPGDGFGALGGTAEPRVRAVPDGDGYRLDGLKDRVEAADQADLLLVTAAGADGCVQLLVPVDTPGVTVQPTWTLDLTRRTAQVGFDDVRLDSAAVVHTGAAATSAIRTQARTAALLTAAESTGAAGVALDRTLSWLFDRYTFGRPLASYQALKHRMADNKTWLEACRATSFAAAALWDAGAADPDEAVSVAKSYVGAKAPAIAQDCVQLHGGIGVTWEHDLHLYLRRITLGRALYGTPEEHRRHLTDLLERSAA